MQNYGKTNSHTCFREYQSIENVDRLPGKEKKSHFLLMLRIFVHTTRGEKTQTGPLSIQFWLCKQIHTDSESQRQLEIGKDL